MRRFDRFAPLGVALLSLLISAVVATFTPLPEPQFHDEFSYLLAGDTFARGRVTNPPHPMWRHFETMHELFQPTYMSKFHPAQGLTLALGQALFGAPWFGVVLSTSLGCAALAWALFGWLRPRWALLGGLIATIHPQIVIWSHMYWGGSVGVLGGALVFGAIPRILRRAHVARNAALLALGGAILATSRPYEAMVWAVLSGATLLGWLVRQHARDMPRLLARLALPALAVLVPVIAMTGCYNWRVTGNPRELPYTLHARQYMAVPLLYWQSIENPKTRADYRHATLADQHLNFEWNYFHGQRSLRGWFVGQWTKFYRFGELHLLRNLALLVGIVAMPFALGRNRWTWLALAYLLAFFVAYAAIPWFEHHYPGALMAVFVMLAMRGVALVRTWRPNARRVGQTFAWLCVLSCLPVLATVFAREYRNNRGNWWYERHKVERRLTREAGKHLVFVRYADAHEAGKEWVFNAADIDASEVVWARMISPEEDRKLIEYFPDRNVWVVDADAYPAVLTPLPP